MTRVRLRVSLGIVALASLILRWAVPPAPIYTAFHDDRLLVKLAAEIQAGQWLGSWADLGHLTQVKPPGFSLFLAWTSWLPWAPTVTVHLILLAGAALLAFEFRALGTDRWLVLALFAMLAFFPPWFGENMSRLYREGLLVAFTVVALALAMTIRRLLGLRPVDLTQRARRTHLAMFVTTAFLLGVVVSWSVATKPTWYALAAACVLLPSSAAVRWRRPSLRFHLAALAAYAGLVLLGLTSVVGYVVYQNYRHYDVAVLDSYTYGSFPDALNEWASVRSDRPRQFVTIDASMRAAVYEISPTAKRLQPYLELPASEGWRGVSCTSALRICDESAAWFPWDVRDAARFARLADSALEFERTFETIAADIRSACGDGRLSCADNGVAPGVEPLSSIRPRLFIDAVATGATLLLDPDPGVLTRGPYDVTREEFALWSGVVHGLPSLATPSTYRPEAPYLGNLIGLIDQLLEAVWVPLLVLAAAGLVVPGATGASHATASQLRLVALAVLAALGVFVAQLALLEASSGIFLTEGGRLYLLPAFPYMIVAAFAGLQRLVVVRSDRRWVAALGHGSAPSEEPQREA